ncbi:MAG TPA: pirin family protein [Methylomirabilota bacterium]|nr:pirin family protein [Methylomirabilota bacterium]
MIAIRRSAERGHFNHGWLDTFHTFSFGDYYDPKHVAFRSLRVLNEDVVAPNAGFPLHPHRDMEIITYILEGELRHGDSMGNGSVIRPGDVQRMTAGTGVRHKEYNASPADPVHLLQIWILPKKNGLTPSYEQKSFPAAEKQGHLRLVASPDGREGSVSIHQDAELYATFLAPAQTVRHALQPGRSAWVQVADGEIQLNGERLKAGDGAAVSGEKAVELSGISDAEVLVFDLA